MILYIENLKDSTKKKKKKLLEENIMVSLYGFRFGDEFLNMMWKAQETKGKNW